MFRRFKENQAPEQELVKVMSLTLNWTKPSKAANLIDRGVDAGLLEREDDRIQARFDPQAIDVPFGFQPDEELFEPIEAPEPATGDETESTDEPGAEASQPTQRLDEAEGSPILERVIDRIATSLEGEREQAVAAVNAKQEALGGLVTLDAAALLVARERGLDVEEDAREVLERLKSEG